MSYSLQVFFGRAGEFPLAEWRPFLKECLLVDGIDEYATLSSLDTTKGEIHYESVTHDRSDQSAQADFSDSVCLHFEVVENDEDINFDGRTKQRKWVLSVSNIGGGLVRFWSAFFAVPAIAYQYLPTAIIVDTDSGLDDAELYETLNDYLLHAGSSFRAILGYDLANSSGFITEDGKLGGGMGRYLKI